MPDLPDLFYFFRPCARGAGQEVGRSCIYLEFKGKKILVSDHSVLSALDRHRCPF